MGAHHLHGEQLLDSLAPSCVGVPLACITSLRCNARQSGADLPIRVRTCSAHVAFTLIMFSHVQPH